MWERKVKKVRVDQQEKEENFDVMAFKSYFNDFLLCGSCWMGAAVFSPKTKAITVPITDRKKRYGEENIWRALQIRISSH